MKNFSYWIIWIRIYISKIDRIANENIFKKIYNKLWVSFFVFHDNKSIPKLYRNIRDVEKWKIIELIFLDWNGFFCESNLKEFLKKFEKLNYMDGLKYILAK